MKQTAGFFNIAEKLKKQKKSIVTWQKKRLNKIRTLSKLDESGSA
jgi:hypothetical protein